MSRSARPLAALPDACAPGQRTSIPAPTPAPTPFAAEGETCHTSALLCAGGVLTAHYLGAPLQLVAAVVAALLVSWQILGRSRSAGDVTSRGACLATAWVGAMIVIYPLLLFLLQMARVRAGKEGIDFALFSQLVHTVRVRAALETSLIDTTWRNFLTHHFSPYLYLLGWLDHLVQAAPVTLLLVHSLSCAATLLCLGQLAQHTSPLQGGCSVRTQRYALLVCAASITLPAPRIALLWEVRDEIYALPLLLAATLLRLRGHHRRAAAALLAAILFKESLLFIVAACAGVALVQLCWPRLLSSSLGDAPSSVQRPSGITTPLLWYGGVALVALLTAALYLWILPGVLFTPTFSALGRVSTVQELFAWSALVRKGWWLTTVVVPLAPLLVTSAWYAHRSTQGLWWYLGRLTLESIPAAMLGASILLSNFQNMWQPYNYYSVLPTVLLFAALLVSMRTVPLPGRVISAALCATMVLSLVFGGRTRFPKELAALWSKPLATELSRIVPADSVVVAGDYDLTFFSQHRGVLRLSTVWQPGAVAPHFDRVVLRAADTHDTEASIPKWMKLRSQECYRSAQWIVWCATPVSAGTPPQTRGATVKTEHPTR